MREIDQLYNEAEMLTDKLASYTLHDLRKLKDPEREALTEAYDLLVQTLSCLDDASQYREPEIEKEEPYVVSAAKIHNEYHTPQQKGKEPEKKEDSYGIAWPSREDIDFSKVYSSYTCEQKGEEVPEGTPIDNSDHTYFKGDERKFNWDIANAITHLTRSNTVNYDDFYVTPAGMDTIVIKKKEGTK